MHTTGGGGMVIVEHYYTASELKYLTPIRDAVAADARRVRIVAAELAGKILTLSSNARKIADTHPTDDEAARVRDDARLAAAADARDALDGACRAPDETNSHNTLAALAKSCLAGSCTATNLWGMQLYPKRAPAENDSFLDDHQPLIPYAYARRNTPADISGEVC